MFQISLVDKHLLPKYYYACAFVVRTDRPTKVWCKSPLFAIVTRNNDWKKGEASANTAAKAFYIISEVGFPL